ncbi:phosphate/phosphite/phosphonate ABC transporter substrate-binding protein [Novosphingobium mangrovi (ex Huang et al. 2023)]|uniref:Phosphate/phosphite/phosphonate ABC transporter substrate-binding protein n=1 Tax=Novosphingobium mangrovi (ex Huang et al. 2023) TaxID=2976432 RepID=A0ABT2IAE4_9SPHN|nr:phosphate/phosphite/phosphonate ABC transporter substrate-binding protein [Novosphingobium mangrovi (ex Huang et al. 2023)]MCT2401472.1 phosphate/phosphite/phosphonate ABC transporter substrate-binding protein [Novosphingobium mangrovi (ex Huang et al. 2023)]
MRRIFARALAILALAGLAACSAQEDGGKAAPLHVLLIPADGGTESGTLADYKPVFQAVGKTAGIDFDLKVAQSYGAVVEALCNGTADVAFVGPVTYLQARKRGCAQLLAVAVENGKSEYYAGIFARKDGPIRAIDDLRGRSIALGDVNSTSSFVIPVAMLVEAKLDPVTQLGALRLTGSHANSLAALLENRVDAAALSFDSFEKAVREGVPGVQDVRVVARSEPIPYPPLVMNSKLPDALKEKLRQAFADVAKAPGIRPEMIRGYGGKQVDGYDARFPAERFDDAARKMALVSDELKGEILKKSAER